MIKKLMQYFWFHDLLDFFGYKIKEVDSEIYTEGGENSSANPIFIDKLEVKNDCGGGGGGSNTNVASGITTGFCKDCGDYVAPGEYHKCSTARNL